MKSFSESLQITKNMNLAKQCFALMAENGINPEKFVDWYCDFGVIYQEKGVLFEGSTSWLKTQRILSEGWWDNTKAAVGNFLNPQNMAQRAGQVTAKVGQFANQAGQAATNMQDKFHQGMGQPTWWRQAASAEQALNQLHRRIGVSPGLLQAVGGQAFMQTILQLIQILKSKDPAQITAGSPSTPMPPEDSTNDPWRNHTESLREKNEIRIGLRKLQSFGYDPVEFVEWFGKEIQNLNEGLWDSAGEWLGNQWANTMGTANRWLTGGEKQAWGHDAKNRVTKKDSESITAAMQSLTQLQQTVGNLNPQFKQTLDSVLGTLQSDSVKQHMAGQAQQPERPDPNADPNAQQQPDPNAQQQPDPNAQQQPSTANVMQQNQQPVRSDVVGHEMYKASQGDFSAFGDHADEMRDEWEQIKNLSDNDPKKHERFAYLMRYFGHPRQNEIKNIRGNLLAEAMYLAGITIR